MADLDEAVARLRELAPDAPPVAYDAIDTILTALDQYEARVRELLGLVDALRDDDECWYDHHGYCQAHGWFETDPPCPDRRARELLATPTKEDG